MFDPALRCHGNFLPVRAMEDPENYPTGGVWDVKKKYIINSQYMQNLMTNSVRQTGNARVDKLSNYSGP